MYVLGIQNNIALILLSEQVFPPFLVEKYVLSTTIEFNASVITAHFIQVEYEICVVDIARPL